MAIPKGLMTALYGQNIAPYHAVLIDHQPQSPI